MANNVCINFIKAFLVYIILLLLTNKYGVLSLNALFGHHQHYHSCWFQEVDGKRKGLLSVKLEHQDLSTPRGRGFAAFIEQSASRFDKENR